MNRQLVYGSMFMVTFLVLKKTFVDLTFVLPYSLIMDLQLLEYGAITYKSSILNL